jgi:TolB-like protein
LKDSPTGAVFLSYAKQDSEAARRICAALQAAGIEVWFDQTDLRGGDVWDQKIRQQIRDCALFIPVISTRTQERLEGYFRREWRLAVDRTHDMASRMAFLVPVVIDDTAEREAEVPDEFRKVQWTHLPDGETSPAFAQRVSALLAARSAPSRPIRASQPAAIQPSPLAPLPTTSLRPPWVMGLVAVAVIAALAIGYWGWRRSTAPAPMVQDAAITPTPPSAPNPATAISDKSVAVLPFVNMSSDKEQEYFSDGLSDELIQMLANVPDLRVPGRTSSFYFKGKNETIETISKQLRVANLLEGSVRKAGDRLRVTADLVRADSGYHLWSATYDRDSKDIFKVQDEIAAAVVSALQAKLVATSDVASRHTSSTEAYDQYLLAKQIVTSAGSFESARLAGEALRKAIALDPNYAAAYALLAHVDSFTADRAGNAALLQQARAEAEKAVSLAPNEADGYTARAHLRSDFSWDWAGAQADVEKALALSPADWQAQLAYEEVLAIAGRQPEAIAESRKVIAADPLSSGGWATLGLGLMAIGDLDGAEAAFQRALQIHPESVGAQWEMVEVLLFKGRAAEALMASTRINDSVRQLMGTALAQYSLGHAQQAQQALDEMIAKYAQVEAFQIAETYAWRGEKDKAFDWLERAYRQHDAGLAALKSSVLILKLRDDPRYAALLRKMNLPV